MSLPELLASRMGGRTVVVGVGNPSRADDAAGCLVAQFLRGPAESAVPARLQVVEAEEVPESFLGLIVRPPPDTVILVEAVEMGEIPGTVVLLEVEELGDREASTHRTPLSLVARYIRAETGADVFLLGIQPGARGLGMPPSAEVRKVARNLADVLRAAAKLAHLPRSASHHSLARLPEVPC